MLPLKWTLLGGALLALAAVPEESSEPERVETARTSYRVDKRWSVILPDEVWTRIDGEIPLPHGDGEGFRVEHAGPMKLEIDTKGDGRLDGNVKGAGGLVRLRGKSASGGSVEYALRVRFTKGSWEYAPAGAVQARIGGQIVRVIDRDNDGRYDEPGVDAMIVGAGDDASYLSKVVNLGGTLYGFGIAPDGSEMWLEPFEGEVGRIDLASEFASRGKLLSAVVTDRSRGLSFNVASARGGTTVPAGKYAFEYGFAERGAETVRIEGGKMRPIEVQPEGKTVVEWGAPVAADFTWTVAAGRLTVNPDVRFYGRGGEVYAQFQPEAKSPKLVVWDRSNDKVLLEGRFPGC